MYAKIRLILLSILGTLIVVQIGGLRLLYKSNVLARYHCRDAATFSQLAREQTYTQNIESKRLREIVQSEGFSRQSQDDTNPRKDIVKVLNWTMNQVQKVEYSASSTPMDALNKARDGQGLLCGDMSLIFESALHSLGYKTRQLQLFRSLFDNTDTHVTVEVLINKRWVIFDPTFGVSFSLDNQLLGAIEIHNAVKNGKISELISVFHGEVQYPARLETLGKDLYPFFNNVSIREVKIENKLDALPPICYWRGIHVYVLSSSENNEIWQAQLGNLFYFHLIVLLPFSIMALSFVLAFSEVTRKFVGGKRTAEPG